jgi:hypothetical protein
MPSLPLLASVKKSFFNFRFRLSHRCSLDRNGFVNLDEERLIDLATRPLADNAELRLAAEEELRKSLEAHAADRPGAVTEAADSLARADRHPKRGRWRIALVVIVTIVFVPLLVHTVWQLRKFSATSALVPWFAKPQPLERNFPHLTAQQKLLLFGDVTKSDETGKWKPLWDSAPENPAYLARYAFAYFQDHHRALSPEIQATAARVDPDNAWFPALVAAGIADRAVTKEPKSSKPGKLNKTAPVWKIDDEKRLNNALAAIHQFSGMPRFTGYQNDLLRQRIPLFPPRTDFISQIPPMLYISSQAEMGIQFQKLYGVLAAGAQQCAAKGDAEGFHQIIGDWKSMVHALAKGGDTVIDVLIARSVFAFPLANFRDAAGTLGLEEDARQFEEMDDRWQQDWEDRSKRSKAGGVAEDFGGGHGSVLGSMTAPLTGRQLKSPSVLPETELRPGRYADYALLDRLCSWVGFILLGNFAASAVGLRHRQSPLARRLSLRMLDLLRWSDWAWMVLGGIVFPMLWYFFITRLTPLSAREWTASKSGFIQPGGQFGCMLIAMIILPVVIAGWRLAKRGAAFGLVARFQRFGWVAGAAAVLGVPAFGGMMMPSGIGWFFEMAAYALVAITVFWLVVALVWDAFFCRQMLRQATMARILWPVWVFGMLALVAMVPFYYAEERHWVQRDRLFEISAECPGPSRYEYEVTQLLRAEVLEMMKPAEGIR